MITDEELEVEIGDDTPPIKAQAEAKGWACDIWSFGKAENAGIEYFNPGLVRRPDGLWLLVRRSEIREGLRFGMNAIWAVKINEENRALMAGTRLMFPDSGQEEQFEDPRAVYWQGQTWIGCCNFIWYPNGSWTGAHQMIGIFKDQSGSDQITEASWTPVARRDPAIGTNSERKGHTGGSHNKNLLWWFFEDKLHCLYHSDPWQVVEFGAKWDEQTLHSGDGVKWRYGWVRGGTPPVQVGDLFYTFFHSSLPWRGRYRRYFMGAIAFEAKPPFKPVYWTQEPILTASQNDPWHQRKPLVVFPCGAVMENGKWLVSLGVNDLKCAWFEMPHEDLVKILRPAPVIAGLALLAERTEKPSNEPIPYDGAMPVVPMDGEKLPAFVEQHYPIARKDSSMGEQTLKQPTQLQGVKDAGSIPAPSVLEKRRANMAKARAARAAKAAAKKKDIAPASVRK